jgi:hypothetical protein
MLVILVLILGVSVVNTVRSTWKERVERIKAARAYKESQTNGWGESTLVTQSDKSKHSPRVRVESVLDLTSIEINLFQGEHISKSNNSPLQRTHTNLDADEI